LVLPHLPRPRFLAFLSLGGILWGLYPFPRYKHRQFLAGCGVCLFGSLPRLLTVRQSCAACSSFGSIRSGNISRIFASGLSEGVNALGCSPPLPEEYELPQLLVPRNRTKGGHPFPSLSWGKSLKHPNPFPFGKTRVFVPW